MPWLRKDLLLDLLFCGLFGARRPLLSSHACLYIVHIARLMVLLRYVFHAMTTGMKLWELDRAPAQPQAAAIAAKDT